MAYRTVDRKENLFLLRNKFDNQEVLNSLKSKIENNLEETNYNKTNVKAHMTSWNFFNEDEDFIFFFKSLVPDIRRLLGPQKSIYIHNAWGTMLSEGEHYVKRHEHKRVDFFCGVLHLSDEGPGLYFEDFDETIQEEFGGYVLFHPDSYHEVKKFNYTKPRFSIAFNINKNWFGETK